MHYLSAMGAPVGLKTFITIFFTVGNEFTKLYLNIVKVKKSKHNKIEIAAKSKLNCVRPIILKAIQGCYISEKYYPLIMQRLLIKK